MFLLWRSRHIYDRRAEEILQCNEEVGIQKTTKAYTKTRGKIISIHQANSFLSRAHFLSVCRETNLLSVNYR